MKYQFIEPEYQKDPKGLPGGCYIRKEFSLDKKPEKAEIRLTACGVYHAYLNGNALDEQVFLPGKTSYQNRLQYESYDVTKLVVKGKNVIAAMVGNGWYRSLSQASGTKKALKFMCCLTVEYEDGSKDSIETDSTWKVSQEGAVRWNDMKLGELYDARLEMENWMEPSFDDASWHTARIGNYEGKLVPCEGEKIKEQERFKPKRVLHTPNGEVVLDFGQNIAGYVEFTVTGNEGTQVELAMGETLDENGNFTRKNLFLKKNRQTGVYPQTVRYILKEGTQTYKPCFCVQGFQYVRLSNWPEDVEADHFTAIAVYSDMKQTGKFYCSNKKINKLTENIRWSAKGNFLDVPTDCPTRERAAWTGDIMVYCLAATYQMDTYKFLKKWLKDVMLEQGKNGSIPNIAPEGNLPGFMSGAAGWADAIVKVPWVLYRFYGDTEILELCYPAIKKHIHFMENRAKKRKWVHAHKGKHWNYIIDAGFHWGEWLEPGSSMPSGALKGFLAPDCETSTAYYAWSVKTASRIAKILGKTDDMKKYRQLYLKIREAYEKEFLKNGIPDSSRQCRYVRPVALGLVKEEQKKAIVKKLHDLVEQNQYKIGTGFLTTPHICNVLTDYGYAETAYGMVENEEQPGWLYEVNKGATTIWENWYGKDAAGKPVNSLNHYSPGAVIGWMYSRVAGIRPLEPGFEKIRIQPIPGGSFSWVECSYESVAGMIRSDWKLEDGEFQLDIDVPRLTEVWLPDGTKQEVDKGTHHFICRYGK